MILWKTIRLIQWMRKIKKTLSLKMYLCVTPFCLSQKNISCLFIHENVEKNNVFCKSFRNLIVF